MIKLKPAILSTLIKRQ
jgi:curved DNA-binding protein CbpA